MAHLTYRKNGAHKHAVVLSQRLLIRFRETDCQLFVRVVNRVAQRLCSKFQTTEVRFDRCYYIPKKPQKALCSCAFLVARQTFILDKILERARKIRAGS